MTASPHSAIPAPDVRRLRIQLATSRPVPPR
jgi:hypothetical protein